MQIGLNISGRTGTEKPFTLGLLPRPGRSSSGTSTSPLSTTRSHQCCGSVCRGCRLGGLRGNAQAPQRVCFLVFANPLHAARRAMAAAFCCPRGQQRFSHPPLKTESYPQLLWVILGQPYLLLPIICWTKERRQHKQRKETKERNKGKIQPRAGPARPPRLPTPARHSPCHPISP